MRTQAIDGGRGIRTPKSFRTAVFKTAALAILPALPGHAVYSVIHRGQPSRAKRAHQLPGPTRSVVWSHSSTQRPCAEDSFQTFSRSGRPRPFSNHRCTDDPFSPTGGAALRQFGRACPDVREAAPAQARSAED